MFGTGKYWPVAGAALVCCGQEKNKLEIGYSRFETASFPGSDSTIERRKMRRFPDTDDDRE
jgi:hypothetical protein